MSTVARGSTDSVGVAVVGGGQAGLATSRMLTRAGISHIVFERGEIAQTWRDRWDSFCLVTPNWTVQLPEHSYDGSDPDGFMPRDDIVDYLTRYAEEVAAPVQQHVDVTAIEARSGSGFALRTTAGDVRAEAVVIATGAYQRPHRPAAAETLPPQLDQLDVDDYRNESALPPGKILIIGSGQSGCQIAEELHEAGREVVLACGKAPWAPRRFGGHDLMWWAEETGFLDASLAGLPNPEARLWSNVLTSGHFGGHDLHLRTLRAQGVVLAGRFLGARDGRVHFANDLGPTVEWGDQRYRQLMGLATKLAGERNLPLSVREPEPFEAVGPEFVDLAGVGAVLFAAGYRPDYRSWLPWPDAFDEWGFPLTTDGASTAVPGLYFVGVHFLRKRKSSLLIGVGEDAAVVAQQILSCQRLSSL